jgi:hypothetical protein
VRWGSKQVEPTLIRSESEGPLRPGLLGTIGGFAPGIYARKNKTDASDQGSVRPQNLKKLSSRRSRFGRGSRRCFGFFAVRLLASFANIDAALEERAIFD